MNKNKIFFLLIILPLFLVSNLIWSFSENNIESLTSYLQNLINLITFNIYVVDPNHNPLPQIAVSILKNNSLIQQIYTDSTGKAEFKLSLDLSTINNFYTIKVTDPSNQYAPFTKDNFQIQIGSTGEISLTVILNPLVNQPPSETTITTEQEPSQSQQIPQPITTTLNIFIKDENNNPLTGIEVRYNTLFSDFPQIIEDSQITDENGKVSFILAAGVYKIYIFDPNQQYVLEEGAKEISLQAGLIVNLEIKLQKKLEQITKVKILGKVFINGQPIKEALVYLRSDKDGLLNTKTDEDGNFIFEVSPNQKFFLQAQKIIDNIPYISPIQETEIKQEDLSLNLNLERLTDKPLFKETKISFPPQEKKEIVLEDKIKIEIPELVVKDVKTLNINLKPTIEVSPQKNVFLLSNIYEMQIFDEKNQEVKKLDKEIKIEIPYNQEFLRQKNIKEKELKIAYFDENKKIWIPLVKSFVDPQRKVVIGFIPHLTKFAIIAFADIVPPQSPLKINLKKLPGPQVQISWQNPSDEDFRHINIYRSEKKNEIGNLIFEGVTTTSVIDRNIQKGKTYYYLLKAVDYAGNISLNTNKYSISLKQIQRFLKKGDRGDDVKLLQEILVKEKLFPSDRITGYFGSLTFKAVSKFQEKYKDEILKPWGFIKGTGFVGPSTLKKINKILETME